MSRFVENQPTLDATILFVEPLGFRFASCWSTQASRSPKKHPPSPAPPIWQPEYHKAYCTLKRGSRKSYMAKILGSPPQNIYGHVFVSPLLDESKPHPVHAAGKEILVKFRVGKFSLQSDQFEHLDCWLVFFGGGGEVHVSGSPIFHPQASMFFETKVATLGFGEATPCLVQTRSWRSTHCRYQNGNDVSW